MYASIKKTQEEIVKDNILSWYKQINDTIQYDIDKYNESFEMFWSEENVTPQERCDMLGNQAYKVFEDSMDRIVHLMKYQPTWNPPIPPYKYTINEDGTVTIGKLI